MVYIQDTETGKLGHIDGRDVITGKVEFYERMDGLIGRKADQVIASYPALDHQRMG